MRTTIATITAFAVFTGGCLANTYKIPPRELARLAATEPAQRGDRVRVVQELAGDTAPAAQPVTGETHIIFVPRTVIVVNSRPRHPRGGGARVPGMGGGGGDGDKAAVILLVVLAAGLAVGLAATEGQRFDGWARLHPMHPVHLWGPWGYGVLPLAQIDPETAATTYKAVVRDREGPFLRLDRAPLDRVGWTYSVLGGVGEIGAADGSTGQGPMFHVQLGHFFSQQVGLQLDWSPGWREDALGDTIMDMRWGLELDVLPLAAGPLHGGLYGNLSLGFRHETTGTTSGVFTGAGALLQLEITTRLALTGRVGITRAYDEFEHDATVGLSIY